MGPVCILPLCATFRSSRNATPSLAAALGVLFRALHSGQRGSQSEGRKESQEVSACSRVSFIQSRKKGSQRERVKRNTINVQGKDKT